MGKLGPVGVVFSGDLLPNVRKIKAAVRRAGPPSRNNGATGDSTQIPCSIL